MTVEMAEGDIGERRRKGLGGDRIVEDSVSRTLAPADLTAVDHDMADDEVHGVGCQVGAQCLDDGGHAPGILAAMLIGV
ncbi:MAG: hypothetical protein GEV08_24520, partial [Acidimicrobiia bacterium]|nr:hypothetical protein [Acidimicrobiia bacterium]